MLNSSALILLARNQAQTQVRPIALPTCSQKVAALICLEHLRQCLTQAATTYQHAAMQADFKPWPATLHQTLFSSRLTLQMHLAVSQGLRPLQWHRHMIHYLQWLQLHALAGQHPIERNYQGLRIGQDIPLSSVLSALPPPLLFAS